MKANCLLKALLFHEPVLLQRGPLPLVGELIIVGGIQFAAFQFCGRDVDACFAGIAAQENLCHWGRERTPRGAFAQDER